MLWYQITRPFAFQRIRSRDLGLLRTALPLAVTVLFVLVYYAIPVKPAILGDKKYLDYVLQIIGTLPGFYIAALAAAATFNNPSLDEQMPGKEPPTLKVMRGGEKFDIPMTMRVFICHLFAYLSAISFGTALLGIAIIEFSPSLDALEQAYKSNQAIQYVVDTVRYLTVGAFTFYVAKVVTITLHGLYFLVERMHLANR